MRKSVLIAVGLVSIAAVQVAPAREPKVTPIFEIRGVRIGNVIATRDGHRIYYSADAGTRLATASLRMFDRRSGRHSTILERSLGAGQRVPHRAFGNFVLSPSGDRVFFTAALEDGTGSPAWVLPLDAATGLASGAARRLTTADAVEVAVSPDGRSMAFVRLRNGNDEALVVAPANGGPERVVTSFNGKVEIWPLQYTPDGEWIVYGKSDDEERAGDATGLYRVRSSGGTPELVVRAGHTGTTPGLSPDGSTIGSWGPSWDSLTFATATGQRLFAYEPEAPGADPIVWIDGNRAMGIGNETPHAVRIRSLGGGASRHATDSVSYYMDPVWSPDGRRFAVTSRRGSGLMVFDERGNGRKVLESYSVVDYAPFSNGNSFSWSPDGRWIAYRGRTSYSAADNGGLGVVNVSTGEGRMLVRYPPGRSWLAGYYPSRTVPIRWTAGSRSVIYGVIDTVMAADSTHRLELREVTTAGADRLLRTVTTGCRPNMFGCVRFVNDSTVVLRRALSEYVLTSLRSSAPDRVLFTRPASAGQLTPTISQNGRWLAVRGNDANGEPRIIEVIATDGSSRRTVTLPFPTTTGQNNPWVSDDGRQLIVSSRVGNAAPVIYYRVTVATGATSRLVEIPWSGRHAFDSKISPDGTSLIYTTEEPLWAIVNEIDLTEMLRAARRGTNR